MLASTALEIYEANNQPADNKLVINSLFPVYQAIKASAPYTTYTFIFRDKMELSQEQVVQLQRDGYTVGIISIIGDADAYIISWDM